MKRTVYWIRFVNADNTSWQTREYRTWHYALERAREALREGDASLAFLYCRVGERKPFCQVGLGVRWEVRL